MNIESYFAKLRDISSRDYKPRDLLPVVPVILMILASVNLVAFSWSDTLSNLGGDSTAYLLAAMYYLSPDDNSYVSLYGREIFFPPVFPIMLVLSGGAKSIFSAHMLVAAAYIVSAFGLYMWSRKDGLGSITSGLLSALYLFAPITYITAMSIWSESLYLAFSIFAFYFIALSEDKKKIESSLYIAATFVALATLTRVAALPLLLAFIIYIYTNYRITRPGPLLLASVPFISWFIYSRITSDTESPYISHLNTVYENDWFQTLIETVVRETEALMWAWGDSWLHTATYWGLILTGPLFYLVAHGCYKRLLRKKMDAFYFIIYTAMLLLWPHPEEALRYGFMLFPLCIYYMFYAAKSFSRIKHLSPQWILAGICFSFVLPPLFNNIGHLNVDLPEQLKAAKHMRTWYIPDRRVAETISLVDASTIEHIKSVSKYVNDDECLFSTKSRLVLYLSRRKTYTMPAQSVNDEEFIEHISRCKYMYILPGKSPSFPTSFYPIERLNKHYDVVSIGKIPGYSNGPTVGMLIRIKDAV